MNDIEIFCRRTKELRMGLGISQKEFAKMAGIEEKELCLIEQGIAGFVRLRTANKIAVAVGLPVSKLFCDDDTLGGER